MKWWGSKKEQGERVYLDWAAATPLLPETKAAMEPYLGDVFGNASAIHKEGQVAKRALEEAREKVARALQVRPEFVTFTGGGTEGNNLAIMGTIMRLRANCREFSDMEIITTAIEHPSITETMRALARRGVVIKQAPVDEAGKVKLAEFKKLLTGKTVLVSLAYANSEIGVVQPLHHIKKHIKEAAAAFKTEIRLHVDAAQAPLWLSCQFDTTSADLLVLDTAKCCGPKGAGVLVRARSVELVPYQFGGGQEAGLRPGTENVASAVGAAVAIEVAQGDWRARAERARTIRDTGIAAIMAAVPQAILNGPEGEERLANNINISIPGLDTEYAAVWLDARGFAVSTKSACAGAGGSESMVVRTISDNAARASSTLRFTIGPSTTVEDLQKLAAALREFVAIMNSLQSI
ncbi:cysteine desulfurase [Candidatus Kaiserbacteria bacterium]|nr:cysteine desulfurase [Candidatus Kaiserbacteria bacterium]